MTLSKFLDPKNDFCFKKIFGTEKNKDILIHFLNDILKYEGNEQITEVTFLKTIQDPEIAAYRQSIVDVLCKEHRLLDTKTYEHDLKDFYFVFLELEKFKKTIDQLENLEQKWLYFFKHAEASTFAEIEHLIGSDIIIRRAFEAIDQAAWTEEELNTYDKMTKTRLDNLAVEQQKIEDAEIRGEARGIAKRDIEIAKKMLSKNHSISDVSDLTGLSLEEISKL